MARSASLLIRLARYCALVSLGIVLSLSFACPGNAEQPPVLHDLPEFPSNGGILNMTLDVTEQKIKIGSATVDGMVYNGDYAGSIMRVHPGDQVRIKLINHLHEPTNLHFHGMQLSPLDNSDNTQLVVKPGETFNYLLQIPVDHPMGLYLYHADIPGSTHKQSAAGLSGVLMVNGLHRLFPRSASAWRQVFSLKEYEFDDSNKDATIKNEYHNIVQTINGQTDFVFTVHPQETQMWRFINQSVNHPIKLAVKGHVFNVLAEDGVATTHLVTKDILTIPPGGRSEALVDAGAAGNYEVISLGVPTGYGAAEKPDRVLGIVKVAGDPVAPLPMPTVEEFPKILVDLRDKAVTEKRDVVFSKDPKSGNYFLNGKTYDPARIDVRVPLGSVEEWSLRNDTDDYEAFHIHQLGAQILDINGEAQPFYSYSDSVPVPAHSVVKIRLGFTNPIIVGKFTYESQIMAHKDKGMMANIEVYDPKVATKP